MRRTIALCLAGALGACGSPFAAATAALDAGDSRSDAQADVGGEAAPPTFCAREAQVDAYFCADFEASTDVSHYFQSTVLTPLGSELAIESVDGESVLVAKIRPDSGLGAGAFGQRALDHTANSVQIDARVQFQKAPSFGRHAVLLTFHMGDKLAVGIGASPTGGLSLLTYSRSSPSGANKRDIDPTVTLRSATELTIRYAPDPADDAKANIWVSVDGRAVVAGASTERPASGDSRSVFVGCRPSERVGPEDDWSVEFDNVRVTSWTAP